MAASGTVVIGAQGKIYVAPTATTAPTDAIAAPGSGWIDLGVITEDGVDFSDERTIQDIEQWNGFYPVRKVPTARNTTLSFSMRQWNPDNLKLALGGGDFTGGTFTPPAVGDIPEWSLIVDWKDGLDDYRLYVPLGTVTSNATFSLTKADNAALPVEFSVLGDPDDETADPYLLFTDATAFSSETES